MGQGKPRLVLIGLDGATWDVITPLLEAGKLPALGALIEQGQSGTLRSVIPPITGPAWATILTGRNPGEHGIFEMTVYDTRLRRRRPITMSDWRATPLWETLNGHGLSTGLLCIPFTYPPPRINGWVISGIMGTPRYDERMFSPPELFTEVTEVAGELPLAPPTRVRGEFSVQLLNRQIEWINRATMHLLLNHPVDVLLVVENYTDHVQHFFYRSRRYGFKGQTIDVVEHAYVGADRLVAGVIQQIGHATPIIVLSDHGFTELEGFINLGVALDEGRSAYAGRVALLWTVGNTARRLLPIQLSEALRRWFKRARPAIHVGGVGGYGSIFTDIRDLTLFEQRLSRIRHPDTKEALVRFLRKEDLYHGPAMDQAPLAVAFPARGWQTRLTSPREGELLCGPRWIRDHEGTHDLDGIIIAANVVGELPTKLTGVHDFCLHQCLSAKSGPRAHER